MKKIIREIEITLTYKELVDKFNFPKGYEISGTDSGVDENDLRVTLEKTEEDADEGDEE